MKQKVWSIGVILLCCICFGCSSQETLQKEEILPKEVAENREDELVFSFSLDDYIKQYNALYQVDHKQEYLRSSEDWDVTVLPKSIHVNEKTLRYDFTADREVWSMPTISVYVPEDGDSIQEITLNLDEHGHTDSLYTQYESMCFYTLQLFFPHMEKENIVALYEKIIHIALENTLPHEKGYENGVLPSVLYQKDGVGIYPYFAIGESLHLCIIPVTEESLLQWEKKGVEVVAVE